MRNADFAAGLAHLARRRLLRARACFARAATAGGRDAPWAVQELVQTYLRRGEAGAAEPAVRALLAGSPALADHAVGYLYRRVASAAEARPWLERAAASGLAAARNELGWLRFSQGERTEGERLLAAVERAFARSGDTWGRASAATCRATASLSEHRLEEAVRRFERAIALKRACGDRLGLGSSWLNLGSAHMLLANHVRALDAFERSIAIMGETGEISHNSYAGMAWNNLGLLRLELGERRHGVEAFQRAQRIFRRCGNRFGQASASTNLGMAARNRGDTRAWIRHLRAALALLGSYGPLDAMPIIRADLAEALTHSGRAGDALDLLGVITPDHVARTSPRGRILLHCAQARAALVTGRLHEADAAARAALRVARLLPGLEPGLVADWLPALVVLGEARLAAGRRDDGLRALSRAAREVERLLDRQPSPVHRAGLLETHRTVHDALIAATFSTRRARPSWRVATRLKAGELRATLARGPGAARAGRRIDAVEEEIRRLAATPELGRAGLERLRRLRKRFIDLDERRRSRRCAPADLEPPRLPGATALVEYHVGARRTFAFVARGNHLRGFDLGVPAASLRRAVKRLLEPMRQAGAGGDAGPHLAGFDAELARRLGRRLLAPILADLPGDVARLVVVPDGPLHALPFDLLMAHDDTAPVITVAASSLLVEPRPARRPRRVLAFAFSPPRGTLVHGPDGDRELQPLPRAAREAHGVAAHLPGTEVVLGRHATAAAFCALAPGRDVLHVAAHAFSDPLVPGLSGLVVAPKPSARGADVLTGARISRLRLRARLVVLSACASGTGRLRAGEGVLGLARAFIEAGAGAVLASLWPVDDAATATLMSAFYERLAAGTEPGLALAGAKRALRTGARVDYRHPYFWAPWVLIDHRPIA